MAVAHHQGKQQSGLGPKRTKDSCSRFQAAEERGHYDSLRPLSLTSLTVTHV